MHAACKRTLVSVTAEPRDSRRAEAEQDFLRALGAVARSRRVVGAEVHRRTGLLPTQLTYLYSIASADGVRINALAQEHLVDPSVASRQVAPLEKQGLVERRPDPLDGRAALLRLTDAGREVVSRALEAAHDVTRPALRTWSTEDIVEATTVLNKIAAVRYRQEAEE